MSTLIITVCTVLAMLGGLIYNFVSYRKNRQSKAEFVLINCVAVLVTVTIYLASTLPN